MSKPVNPVVETYSRFADRYDDESNIGSCWGRAAEDALASLSVAAGARRIADVGCGTGRAVLALARSADTDAELVGLEPADNMRKLAEERTRELPNVTILPGSFEEMPLDSGSVDHLFSILAFHWTTDLDRSVAEIARVLAPGGALDLFFIGRQNGREFIHATSDIFRRYLGMRGLLEAAALRKQLTREQAERLFQREFDPSRLTVEESFQTYYDTLEGHWSWWVRIEGQLLQIPEERKADCDRDVREALAKLETAEGIPYTIHMLHVKVR